MNAANSLLKFWEEQIGTSHRSSKHFFRKTPSHYHMMLLVMSAHQNKEKLCVEELKTKLFHTSRPKSSMMINEACDRGFIHLEKTENDKRRKTVKPSSELIKEFKNYLNSMKNINWKSE